MSQRRFYNFGNDDDTDELNRRQLGLYDKGVYRGFDAMLINPLILRLYHTETGTEEVTGVGVHLVNIGMLVTSQGTIVKEDANINITIDSNPASSDRTDLIVCEHVYSFTTGGTPAVYKVIKGTPGAGVPALTNANYQVVIGTLFLPAFTTTLNDDGVKWTKADKPEFAGGAIAAIGAATIDDAGNLNLVGKYKRYLVNYI